MGLRGRPCQSSGQIASKTPSGVGLTSATLGRRVRRSKSSLSEFIAQFFLGILSHRSVCRTDEEIGDDIEYEGEHKQAAAAVIAE